MVISVDVDHEACQGHGLCFFESSELFRLRDLDGRSEVQLDPVPDHLVDAARRTVDGCPERAISMTEHEEA